MNDIPETTKSEIRAKVRKIVAERFGVDETELKDSASFGDDLGADSLDTVELVITLEEEFGHEIPDEDAEKIQRVQDAIDYISARMDEPQTKG